MPISRSLRGFTLLEMLIIVAIIGILTAIAVPAYNDYVISSKLIEATSQLSSLRVRLEQFYQDNRTYVGACNAGTGILPATDKFAFTCDPAPTETTYTLKATGQANAGIGGFVFTMNQSGVKTTSATLSGWSSSTSCWITKRGGSC